MPKLSDLYEHPLFEAVGAAASKSAVSAFVLTFLVCLFALSQKPTMMTGALFFIGGAFASSLCIAMPVLVIGFKLMAPPRIIVTLTPALTAVATYLSYTAIFSS